MNGDVQPEECGAIPLFAVYGYPGLKRRILKRLTWRDAIKLLKITAVEIVMGQHIFPIPESDIQGPDGGTLLLSIIKLPDRGSAVASSGSLTDTLRMLAEMEAEAIEARLHEIAREASSPTILAGAGVKLPPPPGLLR